MRTRAGFASTRPSSASLRRRILKFLCAPAILLVGILTLQLLFHAAIQDRIVAGKGRSQRGVDGHREKNIGDAAPTGSSFEDSSAASLYRRGTTGAPAAGGALARYFKDEMPADAVAFHAGSGATDSISDANAIWHARLQDALIATDGFCDEQAPAQTLGVWPAPSQVKGGKGGASRISSSLRVLLKGRELAWLNATAVSIVEGMLPKRSRSSRRPSEGASSKCGAEEFDVVLVEVLGGGDLPKVSPENEAYQLSVWRGGAWIVGTTVWGALHGLRSLSQLSSDENGNGECTHVTPTDLLVEDSPRFAHRGFLLDTAHVKLNVPDLLAALRFASSVKLNVFHWHLTDHQSWGVSLPGAEFLSGSCPQSSCYSQEEVREVLRAASSLGVVVVPEIDLPGHSLALEAVLPTSVHCKDDSGPRAHPNCNAALDVRRQEVYDALPKMLRGLEDLFRGALMGGGIHLGGDEVCFDCWREGGAEEWSKGDGMKHLGEWNVSAKYDAPHQMIEYFERRLTALLSSRPTFSSGGGTVIRWEEWMKPQLLECCSDTLREAGSGEPRGGRKNSIAVQFWKDPRWTKPGRSIHDAIKAGVQVIASPELAWYLDPQVDDRFWRTWQDRYLHEPTTVTPHGSPAYPLPEHLHPGVLGGEVACWGRCMASPRSIDAYLWLPMAAVSERLWSSASQRDVGEARPRLLGALSRLGGRERAEGWLRFHERGRDGNGKDVESNSEK